MVSGLNGAGLRFSWQVQRLLVLTSLLLLTLLSGCASLLPPQEIEIPLSRLQQSIQKKFPYTERYFSLLDVTLSNPVLSTQPAADRMLIALDAQVLPPLIKTPWQGELLVSGSLRIDPARRVVARLGRGIGIGAEQIVARTRMGVRRRQARHRIDEA